MARQKFVSEPKFEEYKEKFKDHLIMERKNGIIVVRMTTNGGPVKWSFQCHHAICQAWATIGNDSENEVMIFTSTGDRWIGGGDRESDAETEEDFERNAPDKLIYDMYFHDTNKLVSSLIYDIDIPTIGAINGPGFHTEMGLFCDITICTPDCLFEDGHFMTGWVPGDGQTMAFQQLIGIKRAAYYSYTGENIDAKTALEWGLVNEIVPREKLLDRAQEIAEKIMKQNRVNRRATAQILKRPWKRIFAADYDLHVANEFYGWQFKPPKHDFEKITKTFKK